MRQDDHKMIFGLKNVTRYQQCFHTHELSWRDTYTDKTLSMSCLRAANFS